VNDVKNYNAVVISQGAIDKNGIYLYTVLNKLIDWSMGLSTLESGRILLII
jgi:hypothetical protein